MAFAEELLSIFTCALGYSHAIVGWVGVVEIEGTTGNYLNPNQAAAWCGSIRTYFAENDKYRVNSNGGYPMLISKSEAPAFDVGMNIRAVDSYTSQNSNIDVASTIAGQVGTMRASGKPASITEFGADTLMAAHNQNICIMVFGRERQQAAHCSHSFGAMAGIFRC